MSDALFHEWYGKALDEILYECRELVEDPTFPTVKRWRERGASRHLEAARGGEW